MVFVNVLIYNQFMNISWDLFILLVIGAFVIYGALISKNKILGLLVNLYIALAVVLISGDSIYNFVANFSIISNSVTITEFGTKTITLVALVGLLTIKSEIAGLDSGGSVSKLMAGVYGALTAGLLLSAIISFMSVTERVSISSNFANIIYTFRALFAFAPMVPIIGSAFVKRK